MGVKDLWKILEPVKQNIPLEELKGQILAIDLSLWVCESECVTEMKGRVTKPYLRNLFFRINHLTQIGVQLIFVIDGVAPELKLEEIERRLQQRYPDRKKTNKSSLARKRSHFQALINQCCEMLDYLGITYKKSHGEAEAYAALMNQKGIVDGCITNDGDAFLYGAKKVYKNFGISKDDRHIEMYTAQDIEETLNLNREKLVAMGLFLGCDFLPKGVPGVGFNTSLKYMKDLEDSHILARLRLWHSPRFVASSTTEEQIRKKALHVPNFPNKKVIDEFTIPKDRVPLSPMKTKRPRIFALQRFMHKQLEWEEGYCFQKVLPIVTLFDLRSIKKNPHHRDSCSCLVPQRIVKTRVRQGIPMYEVLWHKMKQDDFTSAEYYTTVEEQTLFTQCFPAKVHQFEQEKTTKSTKSKKKDTDKENKNINGNLRSDGPTRNVDYCEKEDTKEMKKKSRSAVSLEDKFSSIKSSDNPMQDVNYKLPADRATNLVKVNLDNDENYSAGKESNQTEMAQVSSSLQVKKLQKTKQSNVLNVQKKTTSIDTVLAEIQNAKKSSEQRSENLNDLPSGDDENANESILPLSQRLVLKASQSLKSNNSKNEDCKKSTAIIQFSSSDDDSINGDDDVFNLSTKNEEWIVLSEVGGERESLMGERESLIAKEMSKMSLSEEPSAQETSVFLKNDGKNGIKSKAKLKKRMMTIDLDDSLFDSDKEVENSVKIGSSKQSRIKKCDGNIGKNVQISHKNPSVIILDDSDSDIEFISQKLNSNNYSNTSSDIYQKSNDNCVNENRQNDSQSPNLDQTKFTILDTSKSHNKRTTNRFLVDPDVSLQKSYTKSNVVDASDLSLFEIDNKVVNDMSTLSICEFPVVQPVIAHNEHAVHKPPNPLHTDVSMVRADTKDADECCTNKNAYDLKNGLNHQTGLSKSKVNKDVISKLFSAVDSTYQDESKGDSPETEKGNFSLGITLDMTSTLGCSKLELLHSNKAGGINIKSSMDETLLISNTLDNVLPIERVRDHQLEQSVCSLDKTELFLPDLDSGRYVTGMKNSVMKKKASGKRLSNGSNNSLSPYTKQDWVNNDSTLFEYRDETVLEIDNSIMYDNFNEKCVDKPQEHEILCTPRNSNDTVIFSTVASNFNTTETSKKSDDTLIFCSSDKNEQGSNETVLLVQPLKDINKIVECFTSDALPPNNDETIVFCNGKRQESQNIDETIIFNNNSHNLQNGDETMIMQNPDETIVLNKSVNDLKNQKETSKEGNGTVSSKTGDLVPDTNETVLFTQLEQTVQNSNETMLIIEPNKNTHLHSNNSAILEDGSNETLLQNETDEWNETIVFAKPNYQNKTVLFDKSVNSTKDENETLIYIKDKTDINLDCTSATIENTFLFAKPKQPYKKTRSITEELYSLNDSSHLETGLDKTLLTSKLIQLGEVFLNDTVVIDKTLAFDNTLYLTTKNNVDKTLLVNQMPSFVENSCDQIFQSSVSNKTVSETLLFKKPKKLKKKCLMVSGEEIFNDCKSPPLKKNKCDHTNQPAGEKSIQSIDLCNLEEENRNDVNTFSVNPETRNKMCIDLTKSVSSKHEEIGNSNKIIVISPICYGTKSATPIAGRTRKKLGNSLNNDFSRSRRNKTNTINITTNKLETRSRKPSVYICGISKKCKSPRVKRLISTTPVACRTRQRNVNNQTERSVRNKSKVNVTGVKSSVIRNPPPKRSGLRKSGNVSKKNEDQNSMSDDVIVVKVVNKKMMVISEGQKHTNLIPEKIELISGKSGKEVQNVNCDVNKNLRNNRNVSKNNPVQNDISDDVIVVKVVNNDVNKKTVSTNARQKCTNVQPAKTVLIKEKSGKENHNDFTSRQLRSRSKRIQ